MGAVVRQLLDSHGVDPLTKLQGGQGEGIPAEPGVEAAREERGASRLARRCQRGHQPGVGARRVDQVHHRARHHVGPGPQDLFHLGDGPTRPGLPDRGEHHAFRAQGQHGVGIVSGPHARVDGQARQFPGVAPDALGAVGEDTHDLEFGAAHQRPEGMAADTAD